MDQEMLAQMSVQCPCGSGKKAGACCMNEQECACGSEMPAGDCCFASQEEQMEEEQPQ